MVHVTQRPPTNPSTPSTLSVVAAAAPAASSVPSVIRHSDGFQAPAHTGPMGKAASPTAPSTALATLQKTDAQLQTQLMAMPDVSAASLTAVLRNLTPLYPYMDREGVRALSASDEVFQSGIRPLMPSMRANALADMNAYWTPSRTNTVTSLLAMELREEVILKITDKLLKPTDKALLEAALDPESSPAPDRNTLLLGNTPIPGALVIGDPVSRRQLLYLPGRGLEGFDSRQALLSMLNAYLDIPLERASLVAGLSASQQEDSLDLNNAVEPGMPWSIAPVAQPLLTLLLGDYRKAQRRGIAAALVLPNPADGPRSVGEWLDNVGQAVRPGPLGSEGMLERRDRILLKNAAFEQLPDWLKTARPEQRSEHAERVQNWQASLSELNQMEVAASSSGYLRKAVQTQLMADLGYELDPDQLGVSTQRFVPVNGDTYVQTRSLTDLAISGLQSGDTRSSADFIRTSTLTYQSKPLAPTFELLTPTYLATMLSGLPTPGQRRLAQQALYAPQALRKVADQRLLTLAHAAQVRGDIEPDDRRAIESLSQSEGRGLPMNTQVSTLKLMGEPIKDILVMSHGEGLKQRWLLFTPGAPRELQWQPFNSQRQLQHEMVSWAANPQMSAWLVQQAPTRAQPALVAELAELGAKPYPAANFQGLVNQRSYSGTLDALNATYLSDVQTDLEKQIPGWYGDASLADREELNRLIEGLAASTSSVATLTRPIETFEQFLHGEADRKINKLLGRPKGSVNPDSIIITTPRETLTYTQMLKHGYDDSLGLITATADTSATFSGPPGIHLGRLTSENVTATVRGQWVGDRYIEQLKAQALDPAAEGYETSRANSIGLMQLQLQSVALSSRLKGHISASQAKWLGASLANLDDPSAAARGRFTVDALRINLPAPKRYAPSNTRQEIIDGVYVFTQPDAAGHPERLMYTPNAPDGIFLRDYERFNSSLKGKGMPAYYQQRASAGDRVLAGQAIDNLRRGATLPALATRHMQNLRDLFYNDIHNRRIENVQETTTGRAEMVRTLTLTSLELIATGLLFPLQAAVGLSAIRGLAALGSLARTSVALDLLAVGSGSAIALKDTLKVAGSLASGDDEAAGGQALEAALNGLFLLLDVYSLGAAVKPAKHLAGVLKGSDAIKALQSVKTPLPPAGMLDVVLEGEKFWVNGNPNILGHFELYRQSADGSLNSAGQFAQRDITGEWSRTGLRGGGKSQSKTALQEIPVKYDVTTENPAISKYPSRRATLPPGVTREWNNGPVVPEYIIKVNGRSIEVKYDFHTNTWRNAQGKPFQYIRTSSTFSPVDLPADALLSEAVQNRALANFGLDISLPFSVVPLDRMLFKPIPRRIHSVWIGGPIPLGHVKTIRANALAGSRNIPPLEMTLHVSIADSKTLAELQSLFKDAPNLKLQLLEESDFYKDFKTTKYFEQYKRESTGPAANQAAAVDTLRYQLIKHQGGIFMDADDSIAAAKDGATCFTASALSTGEGQLVLTEPVSSEIVGMIMQYNTSTFGSLPGNPTLEAISEESYARFKANPDLFTSRPYRVLNTENEMSEYIGRISDVTGPGVFNDVISIRLPEVHKYATLQRFLQHEFYMAPGEWQAIKQSVIAFEQSFQPLDINIGSAHSWMNQR